MRIVINAVNLIRGLTRYRKERSIDWYNKLQVDYPESWHQLYHAVIIPNYKEDIQILRQNLDAICHSNYPLDRIIVVIAFEERDPDSAPKYTPILTEEFSHKFAKLLFTIHPTNISGEIKGKGPNITWAGRQVLSYLKEKKIDPKDVIVTTLDADNRVDKEYMANISWEYLNDPDPIHVSFQPLPMYFNNIWKIPVPMKIMALGSTFWQMIQSVRPNYLRNFSAHAQSMAALVETDFWSVTTIVEDGHQYWRSYFKFNGNHRVIPIFVPVYMDAVQGENLFATFKEQYLQRRRWYWGVSDIPFVFINTLGNGKIPFIYKWVQLLRLLDSHFSLATQSFILMIGWLPLTVHSDLRNTVFGYNFPTVYETILISTSIGMIVTMIVTYLLVPPKPVSQRRYLLTVVKEWALTPFLLPVTAIIFSALPALDSQARQMFNKPFTVFNVTKKIVN